MAFSKQSVLKNYKYAVLHEDGEKHWQFIKDDDELRRWVQDGSIKDGDVVTELTQETVRVAKQKNYIELK